MTGKISGDKGGRRRKGRGFRHAGHAARPYLAPIASQSGFAEPDVLMRWREIAGDGLADLCDPVKVVYHKGADLGATLLVHAEGCAAPQVELSAPVILERVNAYYGYRAVARLKITQATGATGRAAGFAETAARFQGPPPPAEPSSAATAKAAEMARGIQNQDLRQALTRMGGHVLARPPGRKP